MRKRVGKGRGEGTGREKRGTGRREESRPEERKGRKHRILLGEAEGENFKEGEEGNVRVKHAGG